jgi:hypothetical protein
MLSLQQLVDNQLETLDLTGRGIVAVIFSLNTGNWIGDEGAIQLSEALNSNTSLTSLYLSSNILIASFHSHSIQKIKLVLKEPSNYSKHSN